MTEQLDSRILLGIIFDGTGSVRADQRHQVTSALRCDQERHLLAVTVHTEGQTWAATRSALRRKDNGWRTQWLHGNVIPEGFAACVCGKTQSFDLTWLASQTGDVLCSQARTDPLDKKHSRSRFAAKKASQLGEITQVERQIAADLRDFPELLD